MVDRDGCRPVMRLNNDQKKNIAALYTLRRDIVRCHVPLRPVRILSRTPSLSELGIGKRCNMEWYLGS
jgi:hypothetical protein